MRKLDPHSLLSVLWLFILLNIIFRDIHQFVLASHLQMLLTGHYNGIEITEDLMLLGGVLVQPATYHSVLGSAADPASKPPSMLSSATVM